MPATSFIALPEMNPGGLLLVEVPEKIVQSLGEKRRVPVKATINGIAYRTTIAVYGGRYYLPARREIREAAKLAAGKKARVTLETDTAARTVTIPRDLAIALKAGGATDAFRRMPYSHQREHVDSVLEAKRPETRDGRIGKVVAAALAKG